MYEKALSVVIPTLQKNKSLLYNLISQLDKDPLVKEVILIDNSLQGFEHSSVKLKLIVPKENLYVNPSWNIGVKKASEEIVAILNDDIVIPDNFCSRIADQMDPKMGCIGFNIDNIYETRDFITIPECSNLLLEETMFRGNYWGIAIFFYKSSYVEIPDDLKIFCGDDWLFLQNKISKRKNYIISGQNIYHYGSLSSSSKTLNSIGDNDRKLYRKLTRKWWQYVFNIEPVFRGFRLTIFGIEFLHHTNKKH